MAMILTTPARTLWARALMVPVLASAHLGLAWAEALPPSGVAGTVSFNFLTPAPIDVRDFGSYALSSPAMGELQLQVAATPSPFMTASAQMSPFFFGRSGATLQYSVQVQGPTPTVKVQLSLAGAVAGTSSMGGPSGDLFHGFGLQSRWSLEASNGTVASGGISMSGQNSFSDSFSTVVELELAVNSLYRVSLVAEANARSGSAFAFIDPVFSFAPGVGPGYAFEFSEGIGNSPIPEPAPVALLAAGLAVLAVRQRRSAH